MRRPHLYNESHWMRDRLGRWVGYIGPGRRLWDSDGSEEEPNFPVVEVFAEPFASEPRFYGRLASQRAADGTAVVEVAESIALLGRGSNGPVPPAEVLDRVPAGLPAGTTAYVRLGSDRISLLADPATRSGRGRLRGPVRAVTAPSPPPPAEPILDPVLFADRTRTEVMPLLRAAVSVVRRRHSVAPDTPPKQLPGPVQTLYGNAEDTVKWLTLGDPSKAKPALESIHTRINTLANQDPSDTAAAELAKKLWRIRMALDAHVSGLPVVMGDGKSYGRPLDVSPVEALDVGTETIPPPVVRPVDPARSVEEQFRATGNYVWDSGSVDDLFVRTVPVSDGTVTVLQLRRDDVGRVLAQGVSVHSYNRALRDRVPGSPLPLAKSMGARLPRVPAPGGTYDEYSEEVVFEDPEGQSLFTVMGDDSRVRMVHSPYKGYSFDGTVIIHTPSGGDPLQAVRLFSEQFGVRPGGPTAEDLEALASRRLVSMFDHDLADLWRRGESVPDSDVAASLAAIEERWGATPTNGEWVEDAWGQLQYLLPEETTRRLMEDSGTASFIHEVSDIGWIGPVLADPSRPLALVSTVRRWTEGIGGDGMSSTDDVESGGAAYVFTRQRAEGSMESAYQFRVDAARLLRRTDWFSYSSDLFGVRNPRYSDYQQIGTGGRGDYPLSRVRNRVPGTEALHGNEDYRNSETMFKGKVEVGAGELQLNARDLRLVILDLYRALGGADVPPQVVARLLHYLARQDGTRYTRDEIVRLLEQYDPRRGGAVVADGALVAGPGKIFKESWVKRVGKGSKKGGQFAEKPKIRARVEPKREVRGRLPQARGPVPAAAQQQEEVPASPKPKSAPKPAPPAEPSARMSPSEARRLMREQGSRSLFQGGPPAGRTPPRRPSGGPAGGGRPSGGPKPRRGAETVGRDIAERRRHLADYDKIPDKIKDAMIAAGVKTVIGSESVGDTFPQYKGVRPRGWQPGQTWDNVPGFYEPSLKTVYAGKASLGGHGSNSLLLHEYGHAVDYALKLSDDKDIADAHQGIGWKNDYFRQPGKAGLEESVAELFSMIGLSDDDRATAISLMGRNAADAENIEKMYALLMKKINERV